MKITKENLEELFTDKKEQQLLEALLNDLDRINDCSGKAEIYIDLQTFHNEYSPERTDPCPDYYGTYSLRSSKTKEMIGFEMNLSTLEDVLGALENFVVDEFGDLEI